MIGKLDHGAVATEVVRHKHADAVSPLGFGLCVERKGASVSGEDRRIASAKAVDALLDIADHKPTVAAHERKDAVLYQVNVLIFVDVDRVVLRGKRRGKLRRGSVRVRQKLAEKGAHVVVLQDPALIFFRHDAFLVGRKETVEHFAKLCGLVRLQGDLVGGEAKPLLYLVADRFAEARAPFLIGKDGVGLVANGGKSAGEKGECDGTDAPVIAFRQRLLHCRAKADIV